MTNLELMQRTAPVMPVVAFESLEHARVGCGIFAAAGLPAIEVTLRNEVAWDCVAYCLDALPDCQVGVGTVCNLQQLQRSKAMGLAFAISPGLDLRLVDEAQRLGMNYLPGVASASEVMAARNAGALELKFFPAIAAGGVAMLKAFGGPFPDVRFCPTGGINAANYRELLALDNVVCVGGSWISPPLATMQSQGESLLAELNALYA